jgi:hypothetical protein
MSATQTPASHKGYMSQPAERQATLAQLPGERHVLIQVRLISEAGFTDAVSVIK